MIGNPYHIQLYLKLKSADGSVMYGDYIKSFLSEKEADRYDNKPPATGTFPTTYLLYKHSVPQYNGRLPISTNQVNLNGIILSQAYYKTFTANPVNERQPGKQYGKYAVTSPFITAKITTICDFTAFSEINMPHKL